MRTPRTSLLYIGFLAVIFAPIVAVLISPGFAPFRASLLADPTQHDAALNRLRQSTPLWRSAVGLYARAAVALGTSPRPDAAVAGRDGWIFLGDRFDHNFSQALGREVLSGADASEWVATTRAEQSWLARRRITSLVVVAPAKWSIYPDRLPRWADGLAPMHTFDRLLQAGGDRILPDLRPALRDARRHADTYSPLNSHWNDYGAYVAWQGIIAALNQRSATFAALQAPHLAHVAQLSGPNEFSAMLDLMQPNPWTVVDLATPLAPFVVVAADGSTQPKDGGGLTDLLDLPRETRTATSRTPLRALVLRDSSGNALSPYLQDAFAATLQIDHHLRRPELRPNLPALVEAFHPDLVLWLVTERYLRMPSGDAEYWHDALAFDCAGEGTDRPLLPSPRGADGVVHLRLPPSANGRGTVRAVFETGDPHVVTVHRHDQHGDHARLLALAAGRNVDFIGASDWTENGELFVDDADVRIGAASFRPSCMNDSPSP